MVVFVAVGAAVKEPLSQRSRGRVSDVDGGEMWPGWKLTLARLWWPEQIGSNCCLVQIESHKLLREPSVV